MHKKIFIKQINDEKFDPMLVTDSIVKTVKFESRYMPKSEQYTVLYLIEGLMDTFQNEVLI